ncbi:gamma-glutamyltransferase family protein [bacterium]|nr:gamma-glutamyltransferase family protein [bacterium]
MDPSALSWEQPYASRRVPVFARNVVATSQPLAAHAGLEMLQEGGNAVDAALAAAIALTVVEPTSNGIGGDAFAMVWTGEHLHGLNGSGRSPAAWTPERFSGRAHMPETGWDSVTVPGAVHAWVSLSERFGRLPFAQLFGPALRYAREGWLVPPVTAAAWARAAERFREFPDFAQTFLPGGRSPACGERFRCPEQADTLRRIAESRGEAFYRGEVAGRIVAASRADGGALVAEDLASHQSEWVKPLHLDYHGVRVHALPPNGQGIATLVALGLLRHLEPQRHPVDSAAGVHLQVEAMKSALNLLQGLVGDPDHMSIEASSLLDDGLLERWAEEIDRERAGSRELGMLGSGGTVMLSAADASGMMVSYIQSNYMGFGSGVVVPGTGIALQNRGAGFLLKPGHPNAVAGGKRPFHTLMPGFVTDEGRPLMSFGVMGGPMQPQGQLQFLLRVLDYGQNPQAAADAPRWRLLADGRLALEQGFDPGVADQLAARGHLVLRERPGREFGGAQAVLRLPDGYCAASDPRKDGQAAGY